MASTYSLNNGFELITDGEQTGTWGGTTNTNWNLLDQSLDGQVSVVLPATGSSGAPNDIAITDGVVSNGRNRLVEFTDGGDLGGTVFVRLTPNNAEKIMFVTNSLTGSRDINLFQGTYNASNDYTLANGETAIVKFDGGGTGAVCSVIGALGTTTPALASDIGTTIQAWDADLDTYAANPLTAAELGELQNIDTSTISALQWGYLGATTAFGASLMDDANAAAALVTLGITSTAAELNILDGATVTAAELNQLDLSVNGGDILANFEKAGNAHVQIKANSSGAGNDDDAALYIDAAETGEPSVIFQMDGITVAKCEVVNSSSEVYLEWIGSGGSVNFYTDSTRRLTIDDARTSVNNLFNFGALSSVTISGGVITVTAGSTSFLNISTQGGASSDDLDTINPSGFSWANGDVVILRAADNADTVVVKHGTGNLYLDGQTDKSLNNSRDLLFLMYNGGNFSQFGWGDNQV